MKTKFNVIREVWIWSRKFENHKIFVGLVKNSYQLYVFLIILVCISKKPGVSTRF